MDRRVWIGRVVLGILAVPRAVRAQRARTVHRIGILGVSVPTSDMAGPTPRAAQTSALLRGLGDLGYVYGEHFVTEPRGAENRPDRYPRLAAELVQRKVDVIVAAGPTLRAVKQATSSIPVVMSAAGDPVGEGLVQSLAHPGGNFTGLSSQGVDLTGKRLELLKEIVPGAGPVAVLWDRTVFLQWRAAEAAARARGWKLLSFEIRDGDEVERVFKAATDARADAVFVFASAPLYGHARRIAALAVKSRLPAMYSQRPYVDAGGLVSYSADINDIWRRAAFFVDRILKGARPGELPIAQPSKFELVINLKAAKSIGLTIPQSVLLRADEVIE